MACMEFENLKEEIVDTLQNIRQAQNKLVIDEANYEKLKHDYEIGLMELKYSDEYMEFKTIKEKEENARIQLQDKKLELLELKSIINFSKYSLDYYNTELRYLFRLYDEGLWDDD